jgi:outer membrane protein
MRLNFLIGQATAVAVLVGVGVAGASADTLEGALSDAYRNNPQLNSQRAIVRATDEGVPQALSGYRPRVSATASLGSQYTETVNKSGSNYARAAGVMTPHGVGMSATQTLFNGYQTANRTRQAESQVSAARATLAVIEQNVLLNGSTAYMNLLRDAAILDLQRRNVEVLQEQLRQTRDRFSVGEVTKTDVAQSESRLAAGRSQVLTAESNFTTSRAFFRQVIGREPGKLAAATPVDRFVPKNLSDAISAGRGDHPNVAASMFGIDVALLQVKINEGALLPSLTASANVQQSWEVSPTILDQFSASVIGQVTVPIYQGGQEYALIRQSKETLGQKRLDLETARDQAQQTVTQSWGQLQAAKAQIEATQAQVNAAEIALNGVREEARVGQRTTLDVLNAQQELVNARVSLVTAQRDRVVASYTVLAAVGGLYAQTLGLKVPVYDPIVHYEQIRDSWAGVRTPDGR